MSICYSIVNNYGLAIIIFTLISKFLLLPISIWVHKNGLKIVQMQPEINQLLIIHYGDKDAIAEGQAALYKKEKYNPLASLFPLAIHIFILMGVIEVIYHPLTYLQHIDAECISAYLEAGKNLFGIDPVSSQAQLTLLNLINKGEGTTLLTQVSEIWKDSYPLLENFSAKFIGIDLTWIPSQMGLTFLLSPLATGASALFLALMQNKLNPLQREQKKGMQWGTLAFSVGISLYLGYFVPAGVALYWISSNLLTVIQQIFLNMVFDPRKVVDYKALEDSRKELEKIKSLGESGNIKEDKALRKRERRDYKRFFSIENKHLVFYSESNGFYKYFGPVIDELIKRSNITIHYISSDPNDQIFELVKTNRKLKAYYIGPRKLITLMMKMDADVVVLTMSDLGNYHYKRSYVRKDIQYIYMFHYPLSTHMVLHTGALDHYDEILCVGAFQIPEIRKSEELAAMPAKKLVVCGYCQLDNLYRAYLGMQKKEEEDTRVLIAPSWQEGNLLDSCLDDLLKNLLGRGWQVRVRPHPEYMKRYMLRMESIVEKWKDYQGTDLSFETDFSSNESIYASDIVITDWSGTAAEFSFITLRPCVFINTPPKINNPEYRKLGIEPQELRLRNLIGISLEMNEIGDTGKRVQKLLENSAEWSEKIRSIRDELIANFPNSAPISAQAILQTVMEQQTSKKQIEKEEKL